MERVIDWKKIDMAETPVCKIIEVHNNKDAKWSQSKSIGKFSPILRRDAWIRQKESIEPEALFFFYT